jgi:hypothetical protein
MAHVGGPAKLGGAMAAPQCRQWPQSRPFALLSKPALLIPMIPTLGATADGRMYGPKYGRGMSMVAIRRTGHTRWLSLPSDPWLTHTNSIIPSNSQGNQDTAMRSAGSAEPTSGTRTQKTSALRDDDRTVFWNLEPYEYYVNQQMAIHKESHATAQSSLDTVLLQSFY